MNISRIRVVWLSVAGLVAIGSMVPRVGGAGKAGARVAIEISGKDFGASEADIQKVLASAAEQLLCHIPKRKLQPILIRHVQPAPITYYKKGPNGEYVVGLATKEKFWCQYTYQFAHELCHILSNYDRRGEPGASFWFEEALCETASLFVLSKMKEAWETSPPYPNFKSFAPSFKEYLNDMLAKPDRRLPPDMTMPMWLRANAAVLSKERVATDRSRMVAAYLLPLFLDEPRGWETLNWYNVDEKDREVDLRTFLGNWKRRVPERDKAFVGRIIGLCVGAEREATTQAVGR